MSDVLPLVALLALATATAVLLERGGRAGYGWITGSEFALLGIALGPAGLDLLSSGLLDGLRGAVWAAAAWLGLRFGLRLRKSFLSSVPMRIRWASLIESVATLLALRGLLELLALQGRLALDSDVAWGIAAVGSASTKSATAWAKAQLSAKGPVIDALDGISTLDDVVAVVGAAVLLPRLHPTLSRLPPTWWSAVAATIAIGVGLGLLIYLLTAGKRFRLDLGWVALFGSAALASGLSGALGLSSLAVTTVAGACVARSRHADALEEMTRATERPLVLGLLVIGGASLGGGGWLLAVAISAAVLRGVAKLVAGVVTLPALPRPARRVEVGTGLLGAGGIAFAVAITLAQGLGSARRDAILASVVGMILVGDWFGTALLRRLLLRADELPSTPPEVAQ